MRKKDLTEGKVWNVLLSLALPIMGTSFMQFMYNFIDMIWVGGLGSNAIASVGSSSFYVNLGYSINSFVVIGTGIKVAHSLGKKDEPSVKSYIDEGIFINTILGLFYGLLLIFAGKIFIQFLNIKDTEVLKNSYKYLAISGPTMFFAFFNMLYSRIYSSFGNNKSALKINIIGVLINVILDPILIYPLKLGVVGAAIATLVANVVIFILFTKGSKGLLWFRFKRRIDINKIKEITLLGFPMATQRILFTVVNIVLAKVIATFGADGIAAQKVGVQIESITFMVIGGLNGAMASYVGQNFGARKFNRIKEGYKKALLLGIIYSVITGTCFLLFPEALAKIFVREEKTVIIVVGYLYAVAFSQLFSTIEMVSNGLFTGIGLPKIPATISIIFTISRIPIALLLMKLLGINGIWWAIAISSMLKGITAFIIYLVILRRGKL